MNEMPDEQTASATAPKRTRFRMPGLSTQIFIALGLGIVAGIFFGEMMTVLEPVGEVFIGLLQMTVWPYVVVALIGGLGRLSPKQARSLGLRGGGFLVLFWIIGLTSVLALVATFPSWTSATFFRTSLADKPPDFDFVGLYVPSNPFASLANGVLPAVVLFCVATGFALIPMEEKKRPILAALDVLTNAFMAIASFVVRLAPLGVFALVGVAAGTLRAEQFVRLQVYIYSYIGIALVLSLWVVPALVTALLPISYRQLMRIAQKPLVTAFATGSLLVALPLIAEAAKKGLAEMGERSRTAESAVDVVVPVNFTLPHIGKLISLAFVPFAGWLTGFAMSAGQYPLLLAAGLPSMFAEVIALPFLLDLMRIPADSFQLFVTLDVTTGRFGQMLGGVHTLALALLIGGGAMGLLKAQRAALIRYAAVTLVLIITVVGGLRLLYEFALPHEYALDERFENMTLVTEPVLFKVRETPQEGDHLPGRSRVDQVVARGVLRVGYLEDSLPHVFVNARSQLVGLDVDLCHMIARDLDVHLEFVKIPRESMAVDLGAGRCDLMVSGLAITPDRLLEMKFSEPYMKGTLSFVVRDHMRSKFSSREAAQSLPRPRIGVLDVPYYVEKLRFFLPKAEIVKLESAEAFFRPRNADLDAMYLTAEQGAAWTLIHPEYSVAIPQPDVRAVPIAIGMARDARLLADYVDEWLRLKREDGTLNDLYRHWILGAGAQPQEPRWSVIRDVLGWVE